MAPSLLLIGDVGEAVSMSDELLRENLCLMDPKTEGLPMVFCMWKDEVEVGRT